MRLWHKDLLDFLPDRQFKGQLREIVAIMHDWRDKGQTNHILINKVMEYPKYELVSYFIQYRIAYEERYETKINDKIVNQFNEFRDFEIYTPHPFDNWHNKEYLRICMANLYEKYKYGVGKSKITDQEWQRLLFGYKLITNKDYEI